MDMGGRLRQAIAATAVLTSAVVMGQVLTQPLVAHAQATYSIVGGPTATPAMGGENYFQAASFDGRMVSTTDGVYDRIGNVRVDPHFPNAYTPVIRNGQWVVTTYDRLDPIADTDTTRDTYVVPPGGAPARLMTPGGSASSQMFGIVNANATRSVFYDQIGNIGDWRVYSYDGTTTTLVMSTSGTQNPPLIDASDDGRYALIREPYTCPLGAECGSERLTRRDLLTGQSVTLALDAANHPRKFSSATISGDGRCFAVDLWDEGGIYRNCSADPNALQLVSKTAGSYGSPNMSMSYDARVVTWLAMAPTEIFGGERPQMFASLDSGPAWEVSVPPGGALPDGGVNYAGVSGDGKSLFFSTRATNIVPEAPFAAHKVIAVDISGGWPGAPVLGAAAYSARTPVRVLDTRNAIGYSGDKPSASQPIIVPMRGRNGVPDNAVAVAIQLTATESAEPGWASAIPTGAAPGLTSNLNVDEAGETIANMAIVPIGPDGSITAFTGVSQHLIVDLLGWWAPATTAVAAGRYQGVGPSRVLDTRPVSRVNFTGARPSAMSTTVVQVAGVGGVPSVGAAAVAVNITIVDPDQAGFIQAGPATGLVPGAASTMNVTKAGQVIAASTIVPVDANGRIAVYSQPSAHIVIDINGWFTDASAAPGVNGLFVATPVVRQFDSRPGGPGSTASQPTSGTKLVTGCTGAAVVGNLTVTATGGPGFVQAGPAKSLVPGATSSINAVKAGETVANALIAACGDGLGFYTSIATDVIFDSAGYMTL